jgi:hypothetical protein
MITAQEKYLTFKGYETDALNLVGELRSAFDTAGMDMPKVLNDFVFNIEVALQNAGILDTDFNEVDRSHGSPWDRGSADSYYSRPRDPHYYPEGTHNGERVIGLTHDQVKQYLAGYAHNERCGDKKNWD